MKADDLSEFGKYMEGALAFWGQSLSEFSLNVWWEAMRRFDFVAVKQAISRHAMNPDDGHFAPKPSDVIKMLSGRTVDSAQVAWSRVDWAVRRVGPGRSVVFDDPLIHRVLSDMGGWVLLGYVKNDEWPFKSNEFQNRYRGYSMRGEIPKYPPVLTGIHEAENRANGFKVEPPTMVGDSETALKVLNGGSNEPLLQVTRFDQPYFLKIENEETIASDPVISAQKLRKNP